MNQLNHGHTGLITLITATTLALGISACGGGGGTTGAPPNPDRDPPMRTGEPPTKTPPDTAQPGPGVPAQTAAHANLAPTIALDGKLHVGSDATPTSPLPHRGTHGNTQVQYGTLRDGAGRDAIQSYLESQLREAIIATGKPDPGLDPDRRVSMYTYPGQRVIRFTTTAGNEIEDLAIRAIQHINTALPRGRRIGFNPTPVPQNGSGPAPGEIPIDVGELPSNSAGYAVITPDRHGRLATATITINRDHVDRLVAAQGTAQEKAIENDLLATVAHEIIHALGIIGHLDVNVTGPSVMLAPSQYGPGHILFPIDRAVLLASHTVIRPVATAAEVHEDLGAWAETSLHLAGELGPETEPIAFGVAWNNGLAQPWATGREPGTTLAANDTLTGRATWRGRLLGFTPQVEAVAGAAELGIELSTLAGSLAFTGLEHWEPRTAPGDAGTGDPWHTARLDYDVAVRGNTFARAGGDEGTVTGAFFGRAHQGMGGTLERDDLTASFAGAH